MKEYRCSCGETDPTKFKGRLRGLCYECQKKNSVARYATRIRLSKPLKCQVCGTEDPNSFYPNGGTLCRGCIYTPKRPRPDIKKP